ncbi:Hsp70 family protein [Streptomyces sp. NPDC059639]|uniref:Hsp70 family protein n=1 Tax=Streptomyces sp. NPDC059639 TaxID=3346891 RepID=UPI0036A3D1A6
MLGIAIDHRIAHLGRFDPQGRPVVTATDLEDLAGTDGVADPAAALHLLLTADEDDDAVLGLPASADREAEARLRRAAEDAGLHVHRIVPKPVAVALHYGAIDEGVHCTILVVDQAAETVELTVLAITPDLTARIVTTRTAPLGEDHARTQVSRALAEATPDAVLLSGGLYTNPARRDEVEELSAAQGAMVRCTTPELAVVHGLLLLEEFGLLRVATGPAPAGDRNFPPPLEDPEPQPWQTAPTDPEPPAKSAPKAPTATATEPVTPVEPAPIPTPRAEPHPEPDPTPEEPAPEPTPEPAPSASPPTHTATATAASSVPASTSTLHSVPVAQLQAIRRDDHLLVLWAWPDDALTARVRWRREDPSTSGDGPRDGDIRCQRRVYEHDGGLDLPLGRGTVTLTVEALVPDAGADTEGAASLRVAAEPPIVDYEPSLRRRLTGARVATVTFTARTGCDLPAVRIVHGLGRYRPTSTAEGTVLHEVPAQRLSAGTPLTVEFPFPSTKGTSWLVCFPASGPASPHERDDPHDGHDAYDDHNDTDIRPTALHRLRVT